jgi:hypothetical protein
MVQGLSRVIHLENYQTVGERSGSWEDEKHMRQKLKASSKTEEIQKARQLLRSQASAQRELKAKQREVLAAQQGKSKEEVQVMKVMNGMIDKLEKSADEQEHMADLAARKAVRGRLACARFPVLLLLCATPPSACLTATNRSVQISEWRDCSWVPSPERCGWRSGVYMCTQCSPCSRRGVGGGW